MLVLIVEGNGSNDMVEKKRGKKFWNLDLPINFRNSTEEQAIDAATDAAGDSNAFFDLVVDAEDSDEELE